MASSIAAAVMQRLPFARATTPLQATTYLLGISLFSISFLVFLNSSISFVITDRIGVKDGVGNIVGTLGFVDELVALVACPVWGLVSDRLGVRLVAVIGYVIIALALVLSVQAVNVYPQLLLARVLFALGATAAATMVTAILPSLTDDSEPTASSGTVAKTTSAPNPRGNARDSNLSIESQLTITPERFAESLLHAQATAGAEDASHSAGKPFKLAGLVGLFTGCGALVALTMFLPLPAEFGRKDGVTMAEAVADSFYVVAVVALLVGVFVFVGLRHLRGEDGKGWRMLFRLDAATGTSAGVGAADELVRMEDVMAEGPATASQHLSYWRLLRDSVELGVTDANIALGYLGGFVARASTVAISLFIPLFVNSFYISNGFCQVAPNDPSPELKRGCRSAYILSSILTGVAQLMGLICAPLFGYLSSRPGRRFNMPIAVATSFGVVGYTVFPLLPSPEPTNVDGRGGTPAVFLVVTLLGISQIGAIVCSLGALGRGVLSADTGVVSKGSPASPETAPLLVAGARNSLDGTGNGNGNCHNDDDDDYDDEANEHADTVHEIVVSPRSAARSRAFSALASSRPPSWHIGSTASTTAATTSAGAASPAEAHATRIRLKGSVAGVYSWCGGAAILILTKLGGYLFDHWSKGAPFYMMAVFNGLLLVASLCIGARRGLKQEC